MTRIVIRKIIWDSFNRVHIKKHNVTVEEVQFVVKNLIAHKQSYKGRYIAIGRSTNRIISVVIRRKGPNTYYIVTARDANKKERRLTYEKEKK